MASDQICAAHGLEILPPPEKQVKQKRMGSREYRSAAKGESWKFRLMNTIDQCMRYVETREDFISLMESEGYQVRWTEGRKNITYTTPEGMKCRDDRLHDRKYTKEVMEYEFRIRAEVVRGGIEATESAQDHAAAAGPIPPEHPTQQEWNELRAALKRLEASVSAQEALLRALNCQAGQLPTQAQLEALARDVAQMRAELKQAGKKKGLSVSLPSLETALSVLIWLALILLGTMVGMVVLRTIWSGLAALWSAVRKLIP